MDSQTKADFIILLVVLFMLGASGHVLYSMIPESESPEVHPPCPKCDSRNTVFFIIKDPMLPNYDRVHLHYICYNCTFEWDEYR